MSVRRNRYLQLDVFARTAGGGNPVGVVIGADGWSDAAMQRLAAWTELVETTFVLEPDSPEADYRLRLFTPSREIAFAAHPSLGSARAVLETGFRKARDGELVQQCDVGLITIRLHEDDGDEALFLRAPDASVRERGFDAHPLLAEALGDRAPGRLAPALMDGGRRWWVAELADERSLRDWHPDHDAIRRLAEATDSMGLCAFARCGNPDFELAVRALAGGAGITEDPASGAANGLVAAWLREAEPDGPLARGYRVSQGREIGRDARLVLRIERDGIWVGGRAFTVIDGHVSWSDTAHG